MKLIRERTVGGGGGGGECDGGGEVVVVGVKFDAQSKELLTWTLMKVAQPGYHVIALHVLHSASEFASDTTSLVSLVKAFDSLLAVYEGFCNLKQVDLKLKVCRGSSVKKILVREAKASGASKVVLGASKARHGIRSSASLAKHCAKKLAKSVSVIAVSNGKIVFQREASDKDIVSLGNSGRDIHSCSYRSIDSLNCVNHLASDGFSTTELLEQSHGDGNVDNSLALVPFQSNVVGSNVSSNVAEGLPESKQDWSFLRRVFLPKKGQPERSQAKRTSLVRWIRRLSTRNSSSIVYPDQKQSASQVDEDCCSDLDAENGAIVLIGPGVSWSPVSPANVSNDFPEELNGLREKFSSLCRFFSYDELLLATSNFARENMVGKGGSSHVYRGSLPDGKELAVKILKPSEDVLKEFTIEIEIITTLCHKNIISLFGFCFEHDNLLLVYDFLQRGSLEENLHGFKKDGTAFGWHERCKVALGVAEALDYLHNGSDKPVIHKDVKSSNILLSSDFEPQLSDFGLAMWASSSSSQVTYTDVAGTFGYMAPEYFMHGKVSDKVDVFAFGVVLLELLSGRMPINKENPNGNESLVLWAKPILKDGKVSDLLDPLIGTEYDSDQIELMVLAATLCTRHSPKTRPQMSIVLKLLQGDEEVKEWARREVKITTEEVDAMDGEALPTNIQSHLNLALLELYDDSCSFSSTEQGVSLEDYLQGRWSRTSSSLTNHVCSE